MKKAKIYGRIIGGTVTVVALVLAWHLYDWKLSLIILIALMGNNIENTNK